MRTSEVDPYLFFIIQATLRLNKCQSWSAQDGIFLLSKNLQLDFAHRRWKVEERDENVFISKRIARRIEKHFVDYWAVRKDPATWLSIPTSPEISFHPPLIPILLPRVFCALALFLCSFFLKNNHPLFLQMRWVSLLHDRHQRGGVRRPLPRHS